MKTIHKEKKYVYVSKICIFYNTIQFTEKNLLGKKWLCLKPSLADRIIHVNLAPLSPFHAHELKAAPLWFLWGLLKPYKNQTSFLPEPYNFLSSAV